MAKRKSDNAIGAWSFLVGVILAVILGVGFTGGYSQVMTYVLVVLGLIVGLLNIADKEVSPFLMSGTVLVIVSALGGGTISGVPYISGILRALLILFVPATVIVAIKNVFSMARR